MDKEETKQVIKMINSFSKEVQHILSLLGQVKQGLNKLEHFKNNLKIISEQLEISGRVK